MVIIDLVVFRLHGSMQAGEGGDAGPASDSFESDFGPSGGVMTGDIFCE